MRPKRWLPIAGTSLTSGAVFSKQLLPCPMRMGNPITHATHVIVAGEYRPMLSEFLTSLAALSNRFSPNVFSSDSHGCKRSSSSPRPYGVNPSVMRRADHRPLRTDHASTTPPSKCTDGRIALSSDCGLTRERACSISHPPPRQFVGVARRAVAGRAGHLVRRRRWRHQRQGTASALPVDNFEHETEHQHRDQRYPGARRPGVDRVAQQQHEQRQVQHHGDYQ